MMLHLCLQCCCLLMWREKKRVNCWWKSFVCLLSLVFTTQIEFCECCVWFQYFTQWCCSCVSNVVVCWCDANQTTYYFRYAIHTIYSLWLPHRLSSTRDDFDPNTSLNDSTPAEPIQLPDDNKTHLWVSFVCLLSFVFTPKREFG